MVHNRGGEGDVVDGKAGAVEDGEFVGVATPAAAAEEDLAKGRMDLSRVELAAADGHVELAAMDRLRAVVDDDERVLEDSRVQLLLAGRIRADRVDVRARGEPLALDERAARGRDGHDDIGRAHASLDARARLKDDPWQLPAHPTAEPLRFVREDRKSVV